MSKHPMFKHYPEDAFSKDKSVVTFGLTDEQRKAVEEAVLPPMPETSSWVDRVGYMILLSRSSSQRHLSLVMGNHIFEASIDDARSIAARLVEFADAIEARS